VRVLHVASEVAPFAQSGGLGDVLAGLPAALASHGLATAVLVPLYRGVAERLAAAGIALDPGAPVTLDVGVHRLSAAIRIAQIGAVRHGFVDCAPLFDRDGGLYGPHAAGEFSDNHLRFAALGRAALPAGELLLGGAPEILHVHDWQGGPAAIYARLAHAPSHIVATIHNLAYRGIFPKGVMTQLGIPWSMFTPELIEFYDQVSFLKAGLALADVVTTVSPSYAREILTPERGEALDGFLRWNVRRLVGIVNGIDTKAWDPATDPALPAHFSRTEIAGKHECRRALAAELGLPLADDEPLIGVIARMTDQKGLDLVAEVVPELARLGARLLRARRVELGQSPPDHRADDAARVELVALDLVDDAAVAQDGDAVAEVDDLVEAVADEDRGQAAVAQRLDDLQQTGRLLARERRGRLVEDQHARLAVERAGDHHELLGAGAEAAAERARVERQAAVGQEGGGATLQLARIDERAAVAAEADVLADGERVDHARLLRHDRDPERASVLRRVQLDGLAVDAHDAVVGAGRVEAVEDLQQRRLAGAVGADHGD